MEAIFQGEVNQDVALLASCGCACHPSAGELSSNKPSVQVGR